MNTPVTKPVLLHVLREVDWHTKVARLLRIVAIDSEIDDDLRRLFRENAWETILEKTAIRFSIEIPTTAMHRPVLPNQVISETCNDFNRSVPVCWTMTYLTDISKEALSRLLMAHGGKSDIIFQGRLFNIAIGDYYTIPFTGIRVRKVIQPGECEADFFQYSRDYVPERCPQCSNFLDPSSRFTAMNSTGNGGTLFECTGCHSLLVIFGKVTRVYQAVMRVGS